MKITFINQTVYSLLVNHDLIRIFVVSLPVSVDIQDTCTVAAHISEGSRPTHMEPLPRQHIISYL